jgi:hypothetical protein
VIWKTCKVVFKTIATLGAVVFLFGMLLFVRAQLINRWRDDGQQRIDAIKPHEIFAMNATHDGITGFQHDALDYDDGFQRVHLTLGSCEGLDGYFGTPEYPTSPRAVSELLLVAPLASDTSKTITTTIIDPFFTEAIAKTTWAHCIAGDKRFGPTA